MQSAEAWRDARRRLGLALCGALLSLYVSAPLAAPFIPSQAPLLTGSAVAPNVMLLADTSGSMDTILMDAGFDSTRHSDVLYAANTVLCLPLLGCAYGRGSQVLNSDDRQGLVYDYVKYSDLPSRGGAGCPSTQFGFWRSTNNAVVCLTLNDPQRGGDTRWPKRYLSYLIAQTAAGMPVTPATDTRMTTAVSVANTLVNDNLNLRMGLAVFNPPVLRGDQGAGGKIQQEIVDLSAVKALGDRQEVTTQQAAANLKSLTDRISALRGDSNTPLAEAYYEMTRYFRGLRPFQGGGTTNYTSPIQYRCQKNYGVVITDGLPTYDRTFPTDDPDDSSRILPSWVSNGVNGSNPRGDSEGDTLYLDDIAKFAFDIDMRKSSSTDKDLAGKDWDAIGFKQQNMRTYTVGFTTSNDMLSAAARNGQGLYYQASDKAALGTALSAALSDINTKIGSGGAGASSSGTLQTGTQFYQTLYDPADWHGTIKAFTLSTTGTLNVDATPAWNTDTSIAVGKVVSTYETWNIQGSGSVVPLEYPRLDNSQRTAIDTSRTNAGFAATGTNAISGTDLVNWAKGTNRTLLRTRTRLLGDIINSPLAVALPTDKTASDLVGDVSYTNYLAKKNSTMKSSLVVNSNDGFMSVIDATGGARTYAYMPSTALTSIATLATPTYGSSAHKFTVDGQIGVYDTQLTASGTWQTLAIGGTGAGGKAYFAVRLFDGASNTPKAIWEIRAPDAGVTNSPYGNLGYAYSKPTVARLKSGAGIVVVGNGYGSTNGVASLFVLDVASGAVLKELVIPNSAGTDNGLSSVRLIVDGQNVAQAAYAGDLKGRLWKFDMSGATVDSWKIAFNNSPLFTAPGGATQPITVQPLVYDHPVNGRLVYFGTGKLNEAGDKTTLDQQAFYAIWDSTTATGNYQQSNLQAQAVIPSTSQSSGQYFTTTGNEVDWNTRKGWYMPLATGTPFVGERIIYPAQTTRGRLIFTTAAVYSTDPCESTGTGRLFELDPAQGKMLSYPVLDTNGDGVVDSSDQIVSGVLFGAGIPNVAAIVSGESGTPDNKYVPDSSGNVTVLTEKGGESTSFRRIMWRQIQ